jgi:TolB-like protein/Flp pilus assembly protein TadD
MKRCPHCNRVENDDTLVFCRADGTPLVSDSGLVSTDAGTVRFGSSPVASEVETNVLAQHATDAGISGPTGPTTVLDAQRLSSRTRELTKPTRRKAVLTIAAIIAAAVAVSAYFYLSRKNNAAIQSVAVLPFTNASGNTDLEYLSDGITESLINNLSQLPSLSVKARSTVFHYKGKEVTPQQVGLELSVQAVLNGRVSQRGDQLTLSLELVDARTGNQIWGEQYNRKTDDLVSLQSEIARDVSNKLRVKLSGADEQKLAKNYTENVEAYQLYLKGQFYLNKRTVKDLQKAVEYFQQAVALEPNYALAFAGLADAYALLSIYGGGPPREAMPKAKEVALKALSLDDQLAEAHVSLGLILSDYDYDFVGAERECKRAIELNPNYATAHHFCGNLFSRLGRPEESFAEFRRALELDPLSLIINRMYGECLFHARKYDESITQLRKTLELNANFTLTHSSLSSAYQLKGNYAAAVQEFAKEEELRNRFENAAVIRESFAKGGWQGFLRAMTGTRQPDNLEFYEVATFHAALGEKDQAFVELNKSYEKRENALVWLKVDPRLDPLRDDPRFADLMRRMGLQP